MYFGTLPCPLPKPHPRGIYRRFVEVLPQIFFQDKVHCRIVESFRNEDNKCTYSNGGIRAMEVIIIILNISVIFIAIITSII